MSDNNVTIERNPKTSLKEARANNYVGLFRGMRVIDRSHEFDDCPEMEGSGPMGFRLYKYLLEVVFDHETLAIGIKDMTRVGVADTLRKVAKIIETLDKEMEEIPENQCLFKDKLMEMCNDQINQWIYD